MKRVFFILVFIFLAFGCASVGPSQSDGEFPAASLGPIKKGERILILAPHPDDETIGCAGVIQEALGAGADVKVAYLTNGDHNEFAFIVYEKRITFRQGEFIHMGEVRRRESIEAMKLLGLDESQLVFLGYPDFGTFNIFTQYWRVKTPFRDFLTHISSVPYKEDLSFGAPYVGESILGDLRRVIWEYRPDKIFVSHPADVNVDHKTLYLFLQVVLRDLEGEIPKPQVYPYIIHYPAWPLPRHYHPELSLQPPKNFLNSEINWLKFNLTPEQLKKKHRAILCYKSQTQSSAFYLFSFGRRNELFGDYPQVQLEKQVSLKERAVSFFGFSEMYADYESEALSGIEKVGEAKGQISFAVLDNRLLIRIHKPEDLRRRLAFLFYLFGYNSNVPFASMPKIRIFVRNNTVRVFDGRNMIAAAGAALELNPEGLIFKVPLEVLGNPEFILAGMKAYGGNLPVDVTGFRKIEIK